MRVALRADSDSDADLAMSWEETLKEFANSMSTTAADRYLGVGTGTVAAAIRRGEIRPYRMHGAESRPRVTPQMLAEWLEEHCRE